MATWYTKEAVDAIVAAIPAGVPGGDGTSPILVVKWSGSAYPVQAATPPAGVTVRYFFGPVRPTTAAWAGVVTYFMYAEDL